MEPSTEPITTYSGKYKFSVGTISVRTEALLELFKKNHEETEVFSDLPLDPDFDLFCELESFGHYKFMTITLEGEIVGYCGFFLEHDLRHKGHKQAIQDMFFIDKPHRGIGIAFINFCDELLSSLGTDAIWRQATIKKDVGRVYERLGYTCTQKSFVRRINHGRRKLG